MAGTQPNHYVTNGDNVYKPIAPSVLNKIMADSKKKAKQEIEKNKSPKTNWITKLKD